jgi:type VI secretion system secreted protein VgrG
MPGFSQNNRLLSMTSPLGADVLLLTAFNGNESLSRLFNYRLEMLSENDDIAPSEIVGKSVTWNVSHFDKEPRYFNGKVSRFVTGPTRHRNLRVYRAEVVPWLWFLTRTSNCRIFQNQTVPDIIQGLFDELGFTDYEAQLTSSYSKWEYCVQYRETAFNFVSRLMEQEGIYYFFRHEDGKHTLVLADATSAYKDCPENEVTLTWGSRSPNHVGSWERRYEFRSGKWAQTDYNFQTPSTNLLTNTSTIIDIPNATKFELFDFPGEYEVKSDGTTLTKIRMEEEEAQYDEVVGSSTCCTFTPGGKFALESKELPSEGGQSYAITSIQHSAVDIPFDNSDRPADYQNSFSCIPDSVTFRAPRVTPKPMAQGPQTAVVVGPSGEEIYTDKYGRIKVQFFWDRLGQKNENSSCWIRVAENWAGKNWGVVFNPRIGQEVLVDFLEGDPDRPIITGRVYNAEQMPPYDLPTNQTRSTIKSRSSKGGSKDNFNELRFEDKMDSEEIYIHAEKDCNTVVENNDTLKVGSDQADDGSQTIQIYNNQTITIQQGDRSVTIQTGNDSLNVSAGSSSTEAAISIELTVGSNSIKIDQSGITISGIQVQINGTAMLQAASPMTQVSGDGMLTLQGGIIMIN